ncbi:MAG TPA: hypothetical protein VMB03_30060 [Bryobacteraceae bacterium]|nr:hypothetical protein [Bryobacteraceae bacterium]
MGIRKAALVAFVASLAGLIGPLWTSVNRMLGIGRWWTVPALLVSVAFPALMLAFYFALFRDPGPMHFSRSLRKLALAAAVTCAGVALVRIEKVGNITWFTLLGQLSTAAYVLLLLIMSRDGPDEPCEEPLPSELMVNLTKLTVLLWSLWVAFQLVRMVIIVFGYSSMERIAFQAARSIPPLHEMLTDVALTFFSQAALLVAPLIVWRSGYGSRKPQRATELDEEYRHPSRQL